MAIQQRPFLELLGENMVKARKKAGMNQSHAAREIGTSRMTLYRWEKAESAPDAWDVASVANVYGVGVNDLYPGEIPERRASGNKSKGPKEDLKEARRGRTR